MSDASNFLKSEDLFKVSQDLHKYPDILSFKFQRKYWHMAYLWKKQTFHKFRDLPPEVRNLIYQMVILSGSKTYHIKSLENGSSLGLTHSWWCFNWEPAEVDGWTRTLTHHPPEWWRKRKGVNDYMTMSPAALLFMNKQIHQETCELWYASNRFHFDTVYALEEFSSSISSAAKLAIRSILLIYTPCEDPEEPEFAQQQQKHDGKWVLLYQQVAEIFKGLKELDIQFHIEDDSHRLCLEAPWAASLLVFRG